MAKAVMNTFLLIFVFWAVIVYDISSHGSLESSKTGRILKDAGLLIYVKPYYNVVEEKTISLYRWGEKNFPYKEVDVMKNKTAEISRKVIKETVVLTKDVWSSVRKYSAISYDYVSSKIPPDFADKVVEVYYKILEFIKASLSTIFKLVNDLRIKIKKWIVNNFSKNTFTWQNMEKVYFETTQKIGVYCSNTAAWIERKFKCLISS